MISIFENINGVTCYMNSILHIIQLTPIFIDYILTLKFKDDFLKKNKNDINESIIYQLYNLINTSYLNPNSIITPNSFRKTISKKNEMWGMNQHQDSQEFLTFLLNSIEEEISKKIKFIPGRSINENIDLQNQFKLSIDYKKINNNLINLIAISMWNKFIKNEFSIIKNLFGGMTYNYTTCEYCKNKNHNFDIFQILQISIPINNPNDTNIYTLDDCLNYLIKTEQMDDNNKISCDFCGIKNKAYNNTYLWKPPKILIIQIKRFMVNNYGIISQKIQNKIEYPINLNIDKYIHELSPYKNINYNLYAINLHHNIGKFNNINFGHYTSIIKNNNKWFHFDDSNKPCEISDIIHKDAYLLFYYQN